jgi:OFA family oxalate/formate antiporter-like MFS transporter
LAYLEKGSFLIKKRRFPRIFFGWWTVLAGGIIALWEVGFQHYGISALFKPISTELGFSRAATSAATSIGRFEGGFEGPIAGWITDRYGPKWIIFFGVFMMALGLVLMNFIGSLWAYLVVWGIIVGTGNNLSAIMPFDTAISNWFVKKRGVALGTKWVLSGLSGVLVVPLIAWLIATQGWRMTCVIGGVVLVVIGSPLVWFFVKQHRPEYYGLLPDGVTVEEKNTDESQMVDKGVEYAAEAEEVEFTVRQAMKTPTYWLLMLARLIGGLVSPIMTIHCIPFLTDIGIDPVKAAGMMAFMVGVSIPMRFLGGLIADRVRVRYLRFIMGGTYLLQAIGIALFLHNQGIATIYVWFLLYGVGMGTMQVVNPLLMARYFGRKAYGSIRGSSSLISMPIGIAAPIYAGWIYDTTGSYMTAFIQFAVLLAVAGLVMCFILPPKRPTEVTDIRKIF